MNEQENDEVGGQEAFNGELCFYLGAASELHLPDPRRTEPDSPCGSTF